MTTSRRDTRQEQELRAIIDDVPGNDKCADCEGLNPRWASYSLGVFLCTRCASIHRKNSDISKVKSISLDQWTPEQIQKMREVGNTISNYKFNPLREWPLQDDDQTMERFIRDKYERHMFMSQRETANFTPVKSAMKGSAKPIEPGKSSSAVIKYSKELDTLREMGFTDRSKNVDVLKKVMGDLSSATDMLVAMEETGGQSAKKHEKPRVRFTADTIGGEEQTPQIQAANPFDMWAQASNASQQQQNFQNPFSSIPPSMYNNQNFVNNVQAQGQQPAPFMGYQNTGQDAVQQQYIQPAVPLRSQLTGGQLLRPQYPGTIVPEQQQQQQQQPPQPLRHQLTGRPQPPVPEPSQNPPSIFQMQHQGTQEQHQSYQAPNHNLFPPKTDSQRFQPTSGLAQPNQLGPQAAQSSQGNYQPQHFQQSKPFSSANIQQSSVPQHDTYQSQNAPRPTPVQPQASLTPQLTGMRPKFQPTVDLNAPFGQFAQNSAPSFQNQSPQITGQAPPAQNNSPQRTGQPQTGLYAPNFGSFQKQSPQVTGQFMPPQSQQSSVFGINRFPSTSPQITGQQTNQATQYGQTTYASTQPPSNNSQTNDPFGANFTSPLRAQLTGIQQSMQPTPNHLQQQNTSQTNNFAPQPYQPLKSQYTGGTAPLGQNNIGQSGGDGSYSFNRFNESQSASQLFSQNTGSAQNGMYRQQTGMNQGNQGYSMPQQPAQQLDNFQPPSNAFQPQLPQQQQQQPQSVFQPQQTGYQQRPAYSNTGINPAKPFDKAGIMSLYGTPQPQSQQYSPQFQQQQQQQQPPQQQQFQQQYTNGYGQQSQQNNFQQGYGGYQ